MAAYFSNLSTPLPSAMEELQADNPMAVHSSQQQQVVQRIVGFTLAGIAGFGNLLLLLLALIRLCSARSDLVHSLGLHAALLGLLHAGYVVIMHTFIAAFPPSLNHSRLWRFNCMLYGFFRQLLPSAYLCLLFVILLAYWTVRMRTNSRRPRLWRCLGVMAHSAPWLFALAALLPLFAMREANALFGALPTELCNDPLGDNWSLLTLMGARAVPLAAHCILTVAVTLRRSRQARLLPPSSSESPRRLPVVVVLYFLVALLTEGVFLVSRTIDILIARSYGKPKFTVVERQALAWTQFCHFCLTPPLLIFLVVHVLADYRRIGQASSTRKHNANSSQSEEVLYTNCMLTSV